MWFLEKRVSKKKYRLVYISTSNQDTKNDFINADVDSFYILMKFRMAKFFISFHAKKIKVLYAHNIAHPIILIDKLLRKNGILHFGVNTPRRLIVRFRDKERYTNERRLWRMAEPKIIRRRFHVTETSMLDLVTFFEIYIAGIRAWRLLKLRDICVCLERSGFHDRCAGSTWKSDNNNGPNVVERAICIRINLVWHWYRVSNYS